MKKVLALVLALLMMCTMIPAMAEGNTVSIFYGGGTPLSIDPALNSASNGSNILRLGHAGLMGFQWVDGVAKLMPELAESYTMSEDGLTYVFTLRKDLKWSDGSDFTGKDLVDSWKRASSEELGADYGFMYDVIEGYEDANLNVVFDEAANTITVVLNSPTAYFLELCAFPTFMPVKVELADNEGIWATKPETYIGMGAFKMVKYAVDDVIAYEKNPYYWNADAVTLDGVNCLLSEDNVAMLAAYESGAACFIDNSFEPDELPRLASTYPDEYAVTDYIGTWYILFNVHKDYSPAGKQLTVAEQSKARFALGQMVNRDDLVEYVTMGGQAAAKGFFPKGLSDGFNADVRSSDTYSSWYTGTSEESEENENYTVDQVAACKTLIDLGYAYEGTIEDGNIVFTDFPAIEFAFNNSGANAKIIQYVQEAWNTFGITAVINTEAWATLQTKLKAGDAEAARMGWIADFNDCVNFLEIFISNSGNNYPRVGRELGDYTKASEVTKDAGLGANWGLNGDQTWADAYDAVVKEIKASTNPEERAKLCAQAEEVLMATGGVAPMSFYTRPIILKSNIKDLILLSTGDAVWTYVTVE